MVICTCLILQSEPVLYLNLKFSFVLCQIEFVLCQIANRVGVLLSRFHSYPAKYEARLIIMLMETRLAAKFEHRLAAKWPRILATQLLRYVFGILGLYFIDKLKNVYELKSVNLKSSFME